MACILLWGSVMRVHDSQAYRKMDVTRERISRVFELRKILLSIQTGSALSMLLLSVLSWRVSQAWMVKVITESRYLKLVTISSSCPFTLISVLMPLVLSLAWSSRH